jgi:DNA-binding beta-propeller fold protein YncE
MIIPAEVLSSDAPSMIIDNPEPLIESRVHPRTVTRVRLPERGRVLDLAVSPAGLENPYLTAGSNTIWALNALDHSSVKFAAGPVGANHLTYGGADQTLFVSGAKQLMAFAPGGARIGTVSLSTSLDGLAYDARSDRLVGLSIARRRLLFFSPTLTSEGSAPVPASLLPRGRPASLAVSSDGTVFVHAAGRNTIAVATPAANSRLRFGTVKLQGLTRPSFGLAAEDNGNLLVVVRHRLVEFQRTGARALRSHYTGMPADGIIRVDHSFSTIPTTATQQFAMQ